MAQEPRTAQERVVGLLNRYLMKLTHPPTFAFEHSAGALGTPDAPTPEEGRSEGLIPLHNAIRATWRPSAGCLLQGISASCGQSVAPSPAAKITHLSGAQSWLMAHVTDIVKPVARNGGGGHTARARAQDAGRWIGRKD